MADEDDSCPWQVECSFLIGLVRSRRASHGNHESLEDSVAVILAANPAWSELVIEFREEINVDQWLRDFSRLVRSLLSSQRFNSLYFEDAQGSFIPPFLDAISPVMTSINSITFVDVPMTSAEANEIFGRLKSSHISDLNMYFSNYHGNGVMNALIDCLQDPSPIQELQLSCMTNGQFVSEEAFLSFCRALPNCPSLEKLWISDLYIRTARPGQVTDIFTTAVISSSLTDICFMNIHNAIPVDGVFRALSRTDAVQNYDLMVVRTDERIQLHHSRWWKRVLTADIPLNVWPIILEEADFYHDPPDAPLLDILYFLVKEKCDVLVPR